MIYHPVSANGLFLHMADQNSFATARRCAKMDNGYLPENAEIAKYLHYFELVQHLANNYHQCNQAFIM